MRARELAEHPLGLTWVIDDAPLQRASHALAHGGRLWLIDPVDLPEALERALALGEPAGVVQLFMGHNRDAQRLATRLAVPLHKLPLMLPGTPFSVLNLDVGPWKERGLWWPEHRGLVIAESIGTGPLYALGRGPAGVHPLRRLLPPGQLRSYLPEHLLVGHGPPLQGGAAAAGLLDALSRSRRDLPRLALKVPGALRSVLGRR